MTYIEELREAARGCFSVLRGDRDAHEYFDLSLRGLTGALIALLIVVGIQAHLPEPPEQARLALGPLRELMISVGFEVLWVLALNYFVRLAGKPDRLVPFLVVYYWGNFFAMAIGLPFILIGFPAVYVVFVMTIALLYYMVRSAMLIIGLRPLSVAGLIAMRLVVEAVAVTILLALLAGGTQ